MGCGNCGSGASGKPGGCKGNGGCSTGGCNRLNVFDWLSALPLHDSAKPYTVIEVSFNKGSRKDFFRNNTHNIFDKGDWIAVEGVGGFDIGQVSLTGELVKLQMKKYSVEDNHTIKRVLRCATEEDLKQYNGHKEREADLLIRARAISRSQKLEMKLCEVEVQADGKKGTFFYTADQRVDFRELIKVYANDFRMKVEMKQIGARQESGKVGGIGSCGRELCCSTWLTDFKSVNTTAARYQNLSINQTKLSGQCGRLKCCLNYELDTYMDALRVFPDHAETLQTVKGNATLQKRDIFKSLMWYSYSDSSKQFPMSIVRVKEIMAMNKLGQKAETLEPVELQTRESKAGLTADMGYVNDVGQITLKALEKPGRKKKNNKSGGDRGERRTKGPEQSQGGNAERGAQGPRPERADRGRDRDRDRSQPVRPPGGQPKQQEGQPNPNAQPKQARPQGEPRPPKQNNQQQPRGPRPERQQPRPEGPPRPEGQAPGSTTPMVQFPPEKPRQGGQPNTRQPQQRPNQPRRDRPDRDRPAGGEQSGGDAPKVD